ncbi:MAG TPA: GNAT family N-acetyltransferase [Xanthobacteraceae bacterium]|nr:GNAT family N-acetyltransferase [Xanthobacteraceae bacterium]
MPPDGGAIAIRAAVPSDAPAIGRVHVEGWREAYRGVLADRLLQSLSAVVRAALWQGALEREPPVLLFVAQRPGGDLVGFAGGGPCRAASLPHDAEVYALYVLRAAQQRGCGRRLMAALAAALRARGFRSVCLWVLEENANARRFYERLGGVVVGERTEVDGEDAFNEVAYGWASLDSLCSAAAPLTQHH